MIADLNPYSAMKNSGVSWLGEVPKHWEVRRLKYLLQERDTRSVDGNEQLLQVSQYTGVTRRRTKGNGTEPHTRAESLVGYKCVEPNDLVVNIMLAWNGSMGVSRFRGVASPAYCIYRFGVDVNPWYLHRLLRSVPYKAYIKTVSTGIVESRLRLYSDNLYQLQAPLPPFHTQAAIVLFLDYVERRVQRYIRAKQKLIALLEEQKQAVIHQAVTGQIDVRTGLPYPEYKPSGLDWLGDVPAHWEVRRNGRLFVQRNETGFPELPILEVSLNTGVRIRDLGNSDRKQMMAVRSEYKRAVKGDIAYNMMRMWQGAVGVPPVDGLVSPAYVVARPLKGTESRYFNTLFRTNMYMAEVDKYSHGIVRDRNRLYWEDFKQIPTPYPPPCEQISIIRFLNKTTDDVGAAIDRARLQIGLLQEYRTRLIADVVTGKLDVREAAARLPEVDPPADEDVVETVHTDVHSNPEERETAQEVSS